MQSTQFRLFLSSLLFSLLLFSACTNDKASSEQEKAEIPAFFDVKGFFQEEINRLATANKTLAKKVIIDDFEETRTVKTANWEQELSLFIDSDINKTAWKTLYKTDKKNNRITYLAKEEDLVVRVLEIVQSPQNQSVEKISVIRKKKNMLYESEEELLYTPDSYSVRSRRKVLLRAPQNISIQAKFE